MKAAIALVALVSLTGSLVWAAPNEKSIDIQRFNDALENALSQEAPQMPPDGTKIDNQDAIEQDDDDDIDLQSLLAAAQSDDDDYEDMKALRLLMMAAEQNKESDLKSGTAAHAQWKWWKKHRIGHKVWRGVKKAARHWIGR